MLISLRIFPNMILVWLRLAGFLTNFNVTSYSLSCCGRRHGISSATFYESRSQCGGMEVSESKRVRSLAYAIVELKKLLAEAC